MATVETYLNSELIEDFCRRWKVREFSLFGSVLRGDFNEASDVDVMVSFRNDAGWSLLDHVTMRDELVTLFGRNVDLVTRKGVERSRSAFRRASILETAKVVYATA
jgi:predicted nucleotidyltransferase